MKFPFSSSSDNNGQQHSQWEPAVQALAGVTLRPTGAAAAVDPAFAYIVSPVAYTPTALHKARQSWISRDAHASQSAAEALLHFFMHGLQAVLLDLHTTCHDSDSPRYLASGEQLHAACDCHLQHVLLAINHMKVQVYDQEHASGTPAADIVDRLIVNMDSLPPATRKQLCWDNLAYPD